MLRRWGWVLVSVVALGCGGTHEPTATATAMRKVFDPMDGQFQAGDRAVVAGEKAAPMIVGSVQDPIDMVLLRPGVEVTLGHDPGPENNEKVVSPNGKGNRFVKVTVRTGASTGASGDVQRNYLRPVK